MSELRQAGLPDISNAFLEKLDKIFPEHGARWKPGDDLPEVARKAGHREVIDWIKRHANRKDV